MPPLGRYLALAELAYFSYGMLFLGWSISEAIFFLWLSQVVYYPFGFVHIALTEGKRTRALLWHFFFYGFFLVAITFILLMAMSYIMQAQWQSSLDNAIMGAKAFVIISASRHAIGMVIDRVQHVKCNVTAAFYMGIGRVMLMFAVMFPTISIIVFTGGEAGIEKIIAWILVVVYFIFEIKKVGHHYTKEELDRLGKQMGFL